MKQKLNITTDSNRIETIEEIILKGISMNNLHALEYGLGEIIKEKQHHEETKNISI